jgi:hypothetical protein
MEPVPDHVRVLNVFGAEYYILWEELPKGGSFFIPTTATAEQVAKALRRAESYFGIELTVRSRCERGVYGARVWRTY